MAPMESTTPTTPTNRNGRLDGKVAIVTGAGRGMGKAIAERFAAEGARVALTGRTRADLDRVAQGIEKRGGRATCHVLDVRDIDAVEKTVNEIASAAGALHVLVNNAGISGPTPLSAVTRERWRDILATNLDGAYFAARAAIGRMKDHDGGRVINIASIGAQVAFPGWTAYCASKSALVGVTRCLAMEVANRGITVNAILPGWVKTAMADAGVESIARDMGKSVAETLPILMSAVPLGRMSEPDEVAEMAVHLASDAGRGITGSSLVISNGAYMP